MTEMMKLTSIQMCLAALVACLIASPGQARIFGENALTDPSSTVSNKEAAYRAIGEVECASPDGRKHKAVALPIVSKRVMLVDDRALGEQPPGSASPICKASFYHSDGALIEAIPAVRVSDRRGLGDLALFILARSGPFVPPTALFTQPGAAPVLDGSPVTMGTLRAEDDGRRYKVRSPGRAYRLKHGTGANAGGEGQIMASDYDSISSTRGSPIFNSAQIVIGIHRGSSCSDGSDAAFDRDNCFNEFQLLNHLVRNRAIQIAASLRD